MFSKSRNKNNNLPSIISADTQFHGNISSQGEVQIDGRVIGDIHAKILTIHENAHIEGNVIAEELNLHGHIIGNVHAASSICFPKAISKAMSPTNISPSMPALSSMANASARASRRPTCPTPTSTNIPLTKKTTSPNALRYLPFISPYIARAAVKKSSKSPSKTA